MARREILVLRVAGASGFVVGAFAFAIHAALLRRNCGFALNHQSRVNDFLYLTGLMMGAAVTVAVYPRRGWYRWSVLAGIGAWIAGVALAAAAGTGGCGN